MKSAVCTLKSALRTDMKLKLAKLSAAEVRQQSEAVLVKLLRLPEFRESMRVSVYLSTNSEISTNAVVSAILNSGKKCFVPRYNKNVMEMVKLHSLQDYDSLPLTKWNIKQPELNEPRENALETGGLDLIIVPGVAFTKNGLRIGHGKGYYDAFLHSCFALQPENKPVTVALAFKEQILREIPIEDHDVKLDAVLSP